MAKSSSEETRGENSNGPTLAAGGTVSFAPLTPEDEAIVKRLRRKVDIRILPIAVTVYLMNFIDRNNYSTARLQGFEADLKLKEWQYQAGLSLFFVGYLTGQIPANLILNRVGRPSIHLAFFTCIWGIASTCTALVKGFPTLALCRLVLGFAEAPFFPGVIFCLSKWYTRQELALRVAIFTCGNLVAGAFGTLIAAGILRGLGHARGIAPWQWLYIVTGSVTVFVGLFVAFIMPDFPETWKALTPKEREVATRRLAIDGAAADVDGPDMTQFKGLKMALSDVNTYILGLAYMCIIGCVGFALFLPSLTASLGYNQTISLLLCTPPFIFMTIWVLLHSWLSDRLNNRFWFYMYPLPVTIVGCIVFLTSDPKHFGPRYLSLFLMPFIMASAITAFSWISTSISRPPAKRAAAFAVINCFATSASIWVPFLYRAPRYTLAMEVNIGLCICAGLLGLIHRFVLVRRNKELDRREKVSGDAKEKDTSPEEGLMGGTDAGAQEEKVPIKGYRYML